MFCFLYRVACVIPTASSFLNGEEEGGPVKLKATVGDSVVFNCRLEFPNDVPIPYIMHWNKGVSAAMCRCGVLEWPKRASSRLALPRTRHVIGGAWALPCQSGQLEAAARQPGRACREGIVSFGLFFSTRHPASRTRCDHNAAFRSDDATVRPFRTIERTDCDCRR